MKENEKGAIMVEASIVLPIFMFVMLSFISMTSLYTTHSKMQYAISQTANEVAVYSYFYSYLGLREINGQMQIINENNSKDPDNAVKNVAQIIDSSSSIINSAVSDVNDVKTDVRNIGAVDIDDYKKNIENIKGNAEAAGNYIDSIIENPESILKWMLGYCANSAVENGKSALGIYLIYPALTYKYLGYTMDMKDMEEKNKDGTGISGKELFLKKMNISNISFVNSSLLPEISNVKSLDNRTVDVMVTYDYTLPFSILPKEASTFHIVQRSVSIGWCSGDDSNDKD